MIRGGFRDEKDRTKLIAFARDGSAASRDAALGMVELFDEARSSHVDTDGPSFRARDHFNLIMYSANRSQLPPRPN
jgi:hypothetical protein